MSDNFHIYTDISALPIYEHEMYLTEGIGGICTGGTASIKVFSVRRQISKNDLITILPLQLASIQDVSEDFSMTFFKVSKNMFMDIMSGLGKITPDFFFYMRTRFQVRLNKHEVKRFIGFCRVLDFRETHTDPVFRRETILHLIRIYYWGFYVNFQKMADSGKDLPVNSHKESISLKFEILVSEHYKTHREIAFYADKLCISPLYLTKVIREINGQSAKELIVDYIILDIKRLLRNANLNIIDVVRQTEFANQSSLSRFFRQHTGMSPSEYRRTIHIIR